MRNANGNRLAHRKRAGNAAGALVERHHDTLLVEHDRRVWQTRDGGLDDAVDRELPYRLPAARNAGPFDVFRIADQRRQPDDGKSDQRFERRNGFDCHQDAEYGSGGNDDEARALEPVPDFPDRGRSSIGFNRHRTTPLVPPI